MAKSHRLFEFARQFLPGGVSSPVRAFQGVGGVPPFIHCGKGPYVYDVEGRQYIDYVASWGPLIVGHAHPHLVEKTTAALKRGFTFGAPTQIEIELAQKICEMVPSIEQVRFVSSGTEAVMSAVRLARAHTQRDKIIKFSGCYHGHSDGLLVSMGSGGLTLGTPSSAGVPESFVQHTLVAPYNRPQQVADLFAQYGEEIAAVLVEPIAANMGLVLPVTGFLQALRELCDNHGSLLIFDEVITGFRIGTGGAQAHYRIVPDLTVLGKVIGGGLPAAAFGGRADIMHLLAPLGPVYQAGTLSGNPIAMAAGSATLDLVSAPGFFSALEQKTNALAEGLKERAAAHVTLQVASVGSMFGLFFTGQHQIETEEAVKQCNIGQFKAFFHGMLQQGIYLAPSAFEVGFVSAAHRDEDIQATLVAAEQAFAQLDKSALSLS